MTPEQFDKLAVWVRLEAKAIVHDKLGHHTNTVAKAEAKAREAMAAARVALVDPSPLLPGTGVDWADRK